MKALILYIDSTPSITEYESANENDAKRLSSGSDVSCDFSMDTNSSILFSDLSSPSNDWATTSSDAADPRQPPSPVVTVDQNHSVTSRDHRFVDSPNSIVQPQRVNIEELDRENQLFLRSRDHRTRTKVKRHEETRRRASAGKKSGKHSRQVAEPARKKHSLKRPVQRPPVVHKDFFIFSYDHVFKEGSADETQSTACENQLRKISCALSDTITKVSQLLDDAEGKAPNLILPHLMWTWLLNVRASYVPFFEFNVDNVHLFRGVGEPLSKLEAAEVRQFFAEPVYLNLLKTFEFYLEAYAYRLIYVVDTSKSVSFLDCGILETAPLVNEYCRWPDRLKDCSREMTSANIKLFNFESGAPEVAQNECLTPNETEESSVLVVESSKPATDVNEKAVSPVKTADECISNNLPQSRCVVKPPEAVPDPEFLASEQEGCSSDSTFNHNEPISMSDCNSNATSLELVDNRCCSLTAEETEEFDSCVESVDGGPASDGWSDICSLPSENSFAFPSLRSEILQCAFQVLGIPSKMTFVRVDFSTNLMA